MSRPGDGMSVFTEVEYRPDIDGLRAVAVLAVVLHHLTARFFPGGYVGVDVFFVISGYLITRIIGHEMADGTFTFARFYERRMRRIFPALFAVLAAVVAAGYFLLLPTDYLATFRGSLGTVLFLANVVFWHDFADGYFAPEAKLNPLLHMWSLGVEEQFYLVLPIFMLLCLRWLKGSVSSVLSLVAGVSLLASMLLLPGHRAAVFFLTPFRAWELLAGALLAFGAAPPLRSWWSREAVAAVGLLAIVIPVFAYEADTSFPGLAALPPVLGAAFLIHAGADNSTIVNRLLQLRPLVYLGLISYSVYLWHWPLIVFARFGLAFENWPPVARPALLVVSLLAASASYHFIEQPFRRSGKSLTQKRTLGAGAFAVLVIVVISLSGILDRGFEGRFDSSVIALDQVRTTHVPYRECQERLLGHPDGFCLIGDVAKSPQIMLWGDSHMLAWLPAFDAALRQSGHSALVAPNAACPPLLGITSKVRPACHAANDATLAVIKAHPAVETVVMAGFWSKYFSDSDIQLSSLAGSGGNADLAPPALRQTLDVLAALRKQVLVLGPVPTYDKDVPLALAQARTMGWDSIQLKSLVRIHSENTEFYRAAESASPRAKIVDVAAWMCRPECVIYRKGASVYRDSNHLSVDGAMLFVSDVLNLMDSTYGRSTSDIGNREGLAKGE